MPFKRLVCLCLSIFFLWSVADCMMSKNDMFLCAVHSCAANGEKNEKKKRKRISITINKKQCFSMICMFHVLFNPVQLMKKASASQLISNAPPTEQLRLALQQVPLNPFSVTLCDWSVCVCVFTSCICAIWFCYFVV